MDKKFIQGLIVKRNPKAPAFVVCKLSFKTDEFIKYLTENSKNGWLNSDVKLSNGGKYYAELDEYDGSLKNASSGVQDNKMIDTTNNGITNELDTISPQLEGVEIDINPEDIPF
jgi:hypothetical protein